MADFTALKTAIQTYIKQNGNEEITGEKLQEILLSVVTTLGDSAINDLITALNNEVAARQNADSSLEGAINQEGTLRSNADATLQGNINAEATARENADTALQAAINLINSYIPAQASSSNKLADKDFVNSSIATATATFRGSYNVVSDLSLSYNATHAQIQTALATKMSALSITPDNNDYAFVQIPTANATPTQIAKVEKYKYNGTAWAFEYELNNSGFTTAQWAAINSGATLELIGKLSALPTNAELTELLAAKQNVIQDLANIRSGATAGASAVQPATLNTALSNTVAESGVYDVTANNDNAKFASLSALLSSENLATLIPSAKRKGGMSIKYVQSSDNKYVQYRSMSDTFNTTSANWQGVDEEPTINSKNLVESGGVYSQVNQLEQRLFEFTMDNIIYNDRRAVDTRDGSYPYMSTPNTWQATDYVDVEGCKSITYPRGSVGGTGTVYGLAFYDSTKTFIQGSGQALITSEDRTYVETTINVPEGAKYVRLTFYAYDDYGTPYIKAIRTDSIQNQIDGLNAEVEYKQDTLIAGSNVSFNGNTINVLQEYIQDYQITTPATPSRRITSANVGESIVTTVSSMTYGITDYIELSDEVMSITTKVGGAGYINYAVCDANKKVLYANASNSNTYEECNIDFVGAKYIIIVIWTQGDVVTIKKNTLKALLDSIGTSITGAQWAGKKWYAYGTSMTETGGDAKYGAYARHLQTISGMQMFNYGLAGSGIIPSLHDQDNVKTRVMRLTDGKDDADLITLEVIPNDMAGTLGEISDVGNDTFLGNLGQCLQYLQENTTAIVIVLIATPPRYDVYQTSNKYIPESATRMTWLTWAEATKRKCHLYGVPCLDGSSLSGLGYYRVTGDIGNTGYVLDQIHLSSVGGEKSCQLLLEYNQEYPTLE